MKPVDRKNEQQGVVDAKESDLDGAQRHGRALFIGGVIVLGGTLVAEIPLARMGPGPAAAGYALATAVWITLVRFARLRSITPGPGAILLIALLLRLPFLFADPSLSGDVFRYRWDGVVSAHGINPYEYAPDAEELAFLADADHASINHPEIPTIYPPLAQELFFVWGITGAGIWLWRLVLIAFDLLIVRAGGRTLGFVWSSCPLVILEGTWSGHIEIIVAAAMLGAYGALEKHRDGGAGIFVGLATGLKLTPIAAIPALLRESRRRLAALLGVIVAVVIPFTPFLGGPMMRGFRDYASRWSFNGLFYETFEWVIEATGLDSGIKSLFSLIKDPLGLEPIARVVYEHLYPAWIARVLCVVPLFALLVFAMTRQTLAGRLAWSVAALLLSSPTLHPWYWLAVLPLAVIGSETLLTCVALASPLSYIWYVDATASEAWSLLLSYALPGIIWLIVLRVRSDPDERHANFQEARASK